MPSSMAAHILGFHGQVPCPHRSAAGMAEANKVRGEAVARKKDNANGKRSRDSAGDNDEAQAGGSQASVPPPPAK
jgi:hypothetical protein